MADLDFQLFQDILGVEYSSLKNSVVTNDIETGIYHSKTCKPKQNQKDFYLLDLYI